MEAQNVCICPYMSGLPAAVVFVTESVLCVGVLLTAHSSRRTYRGYLPMTTFKYCTFLCIVSVFLSYELVLNAPVCLTYLVCKVPKMKLDSYCKD